MKKKQKKTDNANQWPARDGLTRAKNELRRLFEKESD